MSDISKTDNIKASESKDSQTKQPVTEGSTSKSDKAKSSSQQPAATKASSTKVESKQPAKPENKPAEKSEAKSEPTTKPTTEVEEKSEAQSEPTTKVEEKYKVGDCIANANRPVRVYTKADASSLYRLSSEAKVTGNVVVGNPITGYFVPVTYRKSGLGAISGYVLISK